MCCDTVNRGLAYADGKIFLHQADTTLVALDAKDGKVVWQMKNGDPSKGETGTSAPMVVKDKILIGISGGEFGVHCHVTAYDLKSGHVTMHATRRPEIPMGTLSLTTMSAACSYFDGSPFFILTTLPILASSATGVVSA